MSCLTTACSTISQDVLASMQITYTPKVEYSCENSMVPGEDSGADIPTMMLNGTGNCETSPYGFRSFIAGTRSTQTDDLCRLMVYAGEACSGQATSLSMSDGAEECMFTGGKSARLSCGVGTQSQLPVSRLQSLCSNATSSSSSTAPVAGSNTTLSSTKAPTKSTTTAGQSSTAAMPLTATASSNVTTASGTPIPFKGAAAVEYAWQGISVVGIMAVGAAFAML